MKYVVLRSDDGAGNVWTRLGAAEAPDESPAVAVEQLAKGGGVHVAIPWGDWQLFTVRAHLTVEPVRRGAPAGDEPEDGEPDVLGEDGMEELDGMVRPRA